MDKQYKAAKALVRDMRSAADRLANLSYATYANEMKRWASQVEETFVRDRCPNCGHDRSEYRA